MHRPSNAVLAVTVSLVMFVVTEVALRLATNFPIHYNSNKISDPILKYRISSKLSGIDANGFRNPSVLEKADIVTIGDSHTFCDSVPPQDSWPRQLASLTNLTTYNFGVSSYGIFQYIALFDRAVKMTPRYIVLGLYPLNDFQSPDAFIHLPYWQEWLKTRLSPNQYGLHLQKYINSRQKKHFRFSASRFELFLKKHLAVYSALDHLKMKYISPKKNAKYWFYRCPHFKKRFIKNRFLRMDELLTGHSREKFKSVELALKELGKMKEKADQNNIRFILAIIPSVENTIYDHIAKEGVKLPNFFQENVQAERDLISTVMKFSKTHNITTVEILPDLQRALESDPKIYPTNPNCHPLKNGYTVYSKAVFNAVFKE